MGIPYHNASLIYKNNPFTPMVEAVRQQIAEQYGFAPNSCLLNRYADGGGSRGWHADDVTIMAPDTPIVIISLGQTRALSLRWPIADGFKRQEVVLQHGSGFMMSQRLQLEAKHAIRRQAEGGLRISLAFRHLTHSPEPKSMSNHSRGS